MRTSFRAVRTPCNFKPILFCLSRRQWHSTPVLLPRKSHGWRSLVGFSPWGRWSRILLSDFTFTFHFPALEKEMATHSSVLAWRIPGTGSLVGCRLWGRTESDTTEATQQQQHSASGASLVAQRVKNLPAMQKTLVWSLGWEDSPGEGNGNSFQYSCLENSMVRESLEGYSPWGHIESDTIEKLTHIHYH